MASREVVSILKTRGGDIFALCNPDEDWTFKSKRRVIYDIENGIHCYYIKVENREIAISIDNMLNEKHLVARDIGSNDNFLLTISKELVSQKRIYFQR